MSTARKTEEEEDLLTEDPEISSQKIVLLSFLSPEKILSNKDLYFFTQFVRDYDMQWKTSKLEGWMAGQLLELNGKLEEIAGSLDKAEQKEAAKSVRDNLLRTDRFVEEFQEYKRKNMKEMKETTIQEAWEDFLYKNTAKLEEEFHAKNDFRTTIRGLKVRGVYGSEAEAQLRAKKLQKSDPNFNIYMGSVGKWMAWDPDPSRVPNQEYANDQLNTLMGKYRDNEQARDEFYTEQKKQRIGQAKTVRVEDAVESEGGSNVSSSNAASNNGGGSTSYDAMFSGPADLAIQRRMEKEKEKDKST
jgi:hypothetical protein